MPLVPPGSDFSLEIPKAANAPQPRADKVRLYASNASVPRLVAMLSDGNSFELTNSPGGFIYRPLAAKASHNSTTPLIAGAAWLDGSMYPGNTFQFWATAAVGAAGATGYVELYNLTDASSVATLTFNSTTTGVQSTPVAPVLIPSASKVYEVRIYLAATGPGFSIELYSAELAIIQ